jgi:hypothetical protein
MWDTINEFPARETRVHYPAVVAAAIFWRRDLWA